MARQNERRLEESKAEAGQLRNRLTMIEKNINDADADTKLHRKYFLEKKKKKKKRTTEKYLIGRSKYSNKMFTDIYLETLYDKLIVYLRR